MNVNDSRLSLIEELMINEREERLIEDNQADISLDTKNALLILDQEPVKSSEESILADYLDLNLEKKTKWFTQLTNEQIMEWDFHRISSPLLHLPHSLRFLAVQMFRHLLKYMGDRKTGKAPHFHLHQFIRLSIYSPEELKDEAYIQIIKQITHHPDKDKEMKGWCFFSVIASTYPPSEELYRCVIKYLIDIIKDDTRDKALNQRANYIAIRLYKTFTSKRQFPPSESEIELIEDMRPISLPIHFYNGGAKTIKVESYWTIRDIKNFFMRENQVSIGKIFYYSIYEICTKPSTIEERYIDDSQNISDILSIWAIEAKQFEQKGVNISFKLCLKIHLYYSFTEEDLNTITIHYMQTNFEVIQGNYYLNEAEIIKLAALQIIVEHGKKKTNDIVNLLQTTIYTFIPYNHFKDFTKKEWIQKVMTIFTSYQAQQKSSAQAKWAYLSIMKSNLLWQSTQFLCRYSSLTSSSDVGERKGNLDNIPDDCVVGVNPHGVVITDLDRVSIPSFTFIQKEVLRIAFKKIPSWAVNGDLILIVVQNSDKQWCKYYFECNQPKLFQILMDSYSGLVGGKDFAAIMKATDQTCKMFASMPAKKLKEGQSFRSLQASSYINPEIIVN